MLKRLIATAALVLALVAPARANQSNTWSPTTGTVSGLQLTSNYNNAFSALQSCNSGATAPTNDQTAAAVKGQCWLNTSTTPNTVQMYDGASWTTLGWLDTTNHFWIANNGGNTGTIASATTTDLGTVQNPVLSVTGTTTITSFGTTALAGTQKFLNFTGVLTLTHNATSLILPNNGLNITTAAGDTAIAVALGGGNWRVVAYQSASGQALSANANITASIAFTGVISPTALTAGNNADWNPTGLSTAETIRASTNAAGSTLTGLSGGASGRQITLINITAGTLTVTCNDTNSLAANRFQCVDPINLYTDHTATFRYDNTTQRWRLAANQVSDPSPVSFKNLKLVNDNGAPTTTVDVTADYLTVENAVGDVVKLKNVSVAPVMTSSGANGLDTGSIVNNTITWYAVIVIYNPTSNTVAGLYSLQSNCLSATLPAGYTFCARVGWYRTDGAATARWMRQVQSGRRAQYVITASTNTLLPPVAVSGITGTYSSTSPTLASASVSNFVPTTAGAINLLATNIWKSGSSSNVIVAPSTSWGGANNGPQGTNGVIYPSYLIAGNAQSQSFWMNLEAASIATATDGANGAVSVLGWEDNLHHDDSFAEMMLGVANDNEEPLRFKAARRANDRWMH